MMLLGIGLRVPMIALYLSPELRRRLPTFSQQ